MKQRRNKFFIDRSVQGALMVRVLCHWFLLLGSAFVLLPLLQMMISGRGAGSVSESIAALWSQNLPAYVILLALLPALVWDTVKVSNRFAGPMYRIQSGIRKLAAGEQTEPIKLRDDDFWNEVAADFNEMLANRFGSNEDDASSEPEVVSISNDQTA